MENTVANQIKLDVSPIIYSFWRWMEDPEGLSLKSLERKVQTCIESGIKTFDHADIYGRYQMEVLFGRILQQKALKREDIILTTKCGINIIDPSYPQYRIKHYDTSRGHIFTSVMNSLANLQTEYIDILFVHHWDLLTRPEETADALAEVVEKGLVRAVGVANFSTVQYNLLKSKLPFPIAANQIELNPLNTQSITDGTVDFIKNDGSKVLAWSPLAGGRLLDYNDITTHNTRSILTKVAGKYNINEEQLAIAWLLKLGAYPILGTNNLQRIKNAATSLNIVLDHQDWYEIYFAALN